MYHSGVKEKETINIGRAAACELRLDHDSVSRRHAQAQATEEGYIAIVDNGSSNGSWLNRNGQWIRIKRAVLGTQDRVRFGEKEVPLNRLVELFGAHGPVRLREGYSARGKPLVFDAWPGENGRPRVVLENPRRNPLTGDIEENRQD
jgi:hypothetical protein